MSAVMTPRLLLALAFASLAVVAGCKDPVPYNATAKPELQVGTGDGDFEALTAGATVPINYGPQGGSHIWFAARCRGVAENAALTYSIVDDEGNVIAPEQSTVMYGDDIDDQGFRWISSLTAFVEGPAGEGTRLVFHGHIEDDAGHAADGAGQAVVEGFEEGGF